MIIIHHHHQYTVIVFITIISSTNYSKLGTDWLSLQSSLYVVPVGLRQVHQRVLEYVHSGPPLMIS